MNSIMIEDILFRDFSYSTNIIYSKLDETDVLNELAGLTANLFHDENMADIEHCSNWDVNYYGCYNVITKEFNIKICVTLYESIETLKELYPDVFDKLMEYSNKDKTSHKLPLTKEQKDYIFELFKESIKFEFVYDCEEFDLTEDEAIRKSFDDIINLLYEPDIEEEL